MITLIYGEKGTGKTKRIIDSANSSAQVAKGIVVYIDKDSNRIHDLDKEIRLVDAKSYGVNEQHGLLAFIKGMLAANFDIEKIYIDGLGKILNCEISGMEVAYKGIEKIADDFNVQFVMTASCKKEDLPPFAAKYAD